MKVTHGRLAISGLQIYYYERINEKNVRDFHGRIQEEDISDPAVES